MKYFASAVPEQWVAVANALWDGNRLMQGYFCGKAVNFGTTENPKMQTLTLEEQLNWFKRFLAGRQLLIAGDLWQRNHLIQKYFKGELVNFGTAESAEMRRITPEDWLIYFKAAVSGRVSIAINGIWDASPLMREYFIGEKVYFDGEMYQLTQKEVQKNDELVSKGRIETIKDKVKILKSIKIIVKLTC